MTKKEYVTEMEKLGFNPDCRLYHHYEDMYPQKGAREFTLYDAREFAEGKQRFKEELLK